MKKTVPSYSAEEEHLNAWTHGIAAFSAIIASYFLITQAYSISTQAVIATSAYSFSLVLLFTASTLYHLSHTEKQRLWLKKLDHIAIYYLIAGTYTPFLALFIPTHEAKVLLIALWSIALLGTLFKLIFVHRFQALSLIAYLLMGWLAILVIDDMKTYLNPVALKLLVLGGILYSVGTFFYAAKKYKYTHAIWHIFVLLGAASHFFAVWIMLKPTL